MKPLEKLVKLANDLDKIGQADMADYLDNLIFKISDEVYQTPTGGVEVYRSVPPDELEIDPADLEEEIFDLMRQYSELIARDQKIIETMEHLPKKLPFAYPETQGQFWKLFGELYVGEQKRDDIIDKVQALQRRVAPTEVPAGEDIDLYSEEDYEEGLTSHETYPME